MSKKAESAGKPGYFSNPEIPLAQRAIAAAALTFLVFVVIMITFYFSGMLEDLDAIQVAGLMVVFPIVAAASVYDKDRRANYRKKKREWEQTQSERQGINDK